MRIFDMRQECGRMNSRDRFLCAVYLEEPDRVPIGELVANDLIIDKIIGKNTTGDGSAERNVKFYEKLGLDMVPTFLDGLVFPAVSSSGAGESIDPFGRRSSWDARTQTWWYNGGAVRTEEDLERYTPDAGQEGLYETTRKTVKLAGDRLATVAVLDNTELTSQSMGIDYFARAFYQNPELLMRSLEMRTNFVIEAANRVAELGVDALIVCDDMADKHGPMMSPKHYVQYILPQHKRLNQEVGTKIPIIIHGDGNWWALLDHLMEAGFGGIHGLEPLAGMDIKKVKERYGDRWCLMGNVDCSQTLCYRSYEDVIRETKYCIESAAPGGGYILSSSNSLHNAINIENYKTMVDTCMKYGRYPLVKMLK
jgi:uroporphyrinogen decarboxylase